MGVGTLENKVFFIDFGTRLGRPWRALLEKHRGLKYLMRHGRIDQTLSGLMSDHQRGRGTARYCIGAWDMRQNHLNASEIK